MELVPVSALRPADSPRIAGEDPQHAHVLAQSGALLPPIVVHRESMRVVDGMHRLRAVIRRGDEVIRVRFFEGAERDAFVVGVRENTAHGLPLSLADRTAAATRIVTSHGHWSDRAIAEVAGLSARTVGEIRRATLDDDGRPATRLGRDGRIRPLNSSQGRILAARLVEEMPGASLRQIAQLAGISPGTVRDVRSRVRNGEDPVPSAVRRDSAGPEQPRVPRQAGRAKPGGPSGTAAGGRASASAQGPVWRQLPQAAGDPAAALAALVKDPSLKYPAHGRLLLRLLTATLITPQHWADMAGAVPAHSVGLAAQAARACADAWTQFAEALEKKVCATAGDRRLHRPPEA
ncbi:helix-turn-helix domain-containing protein [Streptomyces sp. NPDC058297]|uniref:ParB/RepB/Spo0J family partition protein n=1 Tax=Streptomyces sp. NPDC058297 TaxID=3346433 RepID=UPI0036E344C1